MKTTLMLFGFFLLIIVSSSILANDGDGELETDIYLLTAGGSSTEKISDVTELTVIVRNLLPKYQDEYIFKTNSKRKPFDVLSYDKEEISSTAQQQKKSVENNDPDPCAKLDQSIIGLKTLEKESEVPSFIESINKEISKLEDKSCTLKITKAKTLIAQTTQTVVFPNIEQGFDYVLEISRVSGEKTIKWDYTFVSDYSSEWINHYGFAFLDNKNRHYYSKSVTNDDDTTSYQITKERELNGFNYVPTVMFTYIDKDKIGKKLDWGFTGGLGVDLENPSVLGGISYINGTNLMLTGGVAFTKVDRLKGKYQVTDTIETQLTADDLKTTVYDTTFFIALSFRFGTSPFDK